MAGDGTGPHGSQEPPAGNPPGAFPAGDPSQPAARALAATAMACAAAGDRAGVNAAVRNLTALDGSGRWAGAAMNWWADTFTSLSSEHGADPRALLQQWSPDSGRSADTDPVLAWAREFTAARVRMDHARCGTLLSEVPGSQLPRYATRVLAAVMDLTRLIPVRADEQEPEAGA